MARLARLARAMTYQVGHMHEFPVLLLVCGKRDWPFRVPETERVGQAPPNYGAIYPCVQNILLACRALGLGAALTTMHQVFEEPLCERFGIPEDYGVVVTIPIGYPIGRFGPVRRAPAERVTYFDSWGETLPPGDTIGA
jgi:nitroreductase